MFKSDKSIVEKKSISMAAALAVSISLFSLQLFAYSPGSAQAGPSNEVPKELEGIGITEKLSENIDLNLQFTDENGLVVKLSDYFHKGIPVIISPIYFSCPGLCNFHLNGLTDALKQMDWSVGDKFKVLAVSFDSKEKPDVALKKKQNYMKEYARTGTEQGWHFLTGDELSIKSLTESVGFKYKWNEEAQEWAHASAAIVVTPEGKISRYLPGITFDPKDIKLALNEASSGKIGSLADKVALFCFKYDPAQSKYTFYAFRLVQLGGGLTVLLLAIWLLPAWFRARNEMS